MHINHCGRLRHSSHTMFTRMLCGHRRDGIEDKHHTDESKHEKELARVDLIAFSRIKDINGQLRVSKAKE